MASPITQSIRLRWRPELRFYERRIEILRMLQDRSLLEAFRVDAGSIDAELPGYRWISMRESGLTLNLLTETMDTNQAWTIVESLIGEIGPLRYTHARASYQHLAELPFDFEEAQTRADDRLYQRLSTDEIALTDWALLADLSAKGPPASKGQIELGIVRRGEVVDRLTRGAGRRAPGMEHLGSRNWQPDEFKAVSLFADSDLICLASAGREEVFLDDARAFWASSRDQMGRLIEALGSRLTEEERV